jgi:ectoine hydroxylase-related dioxygenase (phytanoyl-CoA dioxygenase family)
MDDFASNGIAFPMTVLDGDALRDVQRGYAEVVAEHGGSVTRLDRLHVNYAWAYELAIHPRIIEVVSRIIGDDVLVWGTLILSKPPRDDAFIAWHQDGAYASFLGDAPSVSAWIALSDSTVESGCMRVVPGSHTKRFAHRERHDPQNMLSHGQEIAVDVDDSSAIDVQLRAGEMSLHHVDIVHGSNANRAAWWRTGFIVRYSTPGMLRAPVPVVIARGANAPHLNVMNGPP